MSDVDLSCPECGKTDYVIIGIVWGLCYGGLQVQCPCGASWEFQVKKRYTKERKE